MQIYLHIGLHKTGTTLLQKEIFPFFSSKDICYLGRPYNKNHFIEEIVWGERKKTNQSKYLLSSETYPGRLLDSYDYNISYLNLQLEGIKRLAGIFPNAKIILGIRPHVTWILSCYKHYLKYGGNLTLNKFFSLNENSLMRPEEFLLTPRLSLLNSLFKSGVYVYNLDELLNDSGRVLNELENYMGAKFDGSREFGKRNEGVSSKEAQILLWINGKLSVNGDVLHKYGTRPYVFVKKISKIKLPLLKNLKIEFSGSEIRDLNGFYTKDWMGALKYMNGDAVF